MEFDNLLDDSHFEEMAMCEHGISFEVGCHICESLEEEAAEYQPGAWVVEEEE